MGRALREREGHGQRPGGTNLASLAEAPRQEMWLHETLPYAVFQGELSGSSPGTTCSSSPQRALWDRGRMDRQMWSIHTTEQSSTTERSTVLVPATTWTNLENVMLSEVSQTQRTHSACCHSYKVPRTGRLRETGSRMEVPGAVGRRDGRLFSVSGGSLSVKMKRFRKRTVVMSAQQCDCA